MDAGAVVTRGDGGRGGEWRLLRRWAATRARAASRRDEGAGRDDSARERAHRQYASTL